MECGPIGTDVVKLGIYSISCSEKVAGLDACCMFSSQNEGQNSSSFRSVQ